MTEPTRRLTPIERAEKALADAKAKEQTKVRTKLPKLLEEVDKARADLVRAQRRIVRAVAEARASQDFLGDVEAKDLVLTEAEIEAKNRELADEYYHEDPADIPADYVLGQSRADWDKENGFDEAAAPVEADEVAEETTDEVVVVEDAPAEDTAPAQTASEGFVAPAEASSTDGFAAPAVVVAPAVQQAIAALSAGDSCEECGAETAGGVSGEHSESCSLNPDNVV